MKKILSILAAVGLTATASSAVVACGSANNNNEGPKAPAPITLKGKAFKFSVDPKDPNKKDVSFKVDILMEKGGQIYIGNDGSLQIAASASDVTPTNKITSKFVTPAIIKSDDSKYISIGASVKENMLIDADSSDTSNKVQLTPDQIKNNTFKEFDGTDNFYIVKTPFIVTMDYSFSVAAAFTAGNKSIHWTLAAVDSHDGADSFKVIHQYAHLDIDFPENK